MHTELLRTWPTHSVDTVHYVDPDADGVGDLEGIRLQLANGVDVYLSSGTDWTLAWDERADSDLPGWCYPTSSWELRPLEGKVPQELGHCREIDEIRNAAGEIYGLSITYARVEIRATAGEHFRLDLIPSEA
ncbi:hypothetical protein [Streptomyces sp. NPDC007063]|uniref:hypothetical protein n=1 Tax=Streptomyces sp. NPDC007063 TaxID=3364772 RepID=UPI003683777D